MAPRPATAYRRGMCRLGVLLVVVPLLAACGSSGEPAADRTASASPSPTVTPDARYATVEELKDAAVAAGYECAQWTQTDAVQLASSSGSCSDDDLFSVYAGSGERDDQRESDAALLEGLEEFPPPELVGENWIIRTPEADRLQAALGGELTGG